MTPTDAAIAVAESIRAAMASNDSSAQPTTIEAAKTALQRLSEIFRSPLSAPEPTATPEPTPLPRVAETPPPPVMNATPPRVDNQPIAAHTRTAKQDEPIENNVDKYFMNAVMHPTSGKPMTYRELIKDPLTKTEWELSSANEFGCLAQGVGGCIKGTNTICFIPHSDMPPDRKSTYPRFVCELRPQKAELHRT
jgi:hypothetical protein